MRVSELGISIIDSDNILASSPTGIADTNWSSYINSYRHSINAFGGYDTMNFSLGIQLSAIDDWIDTGVGRHIDVYGPTGAKIWEGFVNEVGAKIGGLSINRGPFMDMANRVYVTYRTIRWNTNPPIGGQQRTTAVANDTDDQALHGILETYVSGGESSDDQADDLRDTYLAEFKDPNTNQSISLSSTSSPSVSISCLGYHHILKRYRYNFTPSTLSLINASDKLTDILEAEPNTLFSTDYDNVDTNAMQLIDYDDADRDGYGAIKDIVARGDTSGNRYTFMILEDRKAYYTVMPTTAEYYYSLSRSSQRLENQNGMRIPAWSAVPAEWVLIADFLVGKADADTFRADPKYMFIESVEYTAPTGLVLRGGRTDTFAQKLANSGLGGF